MPFVKTNGENATELFYEETGTGKPVVLVHGWPLSHRMWEAQVTALADAGHRCIAYDRRGFGDSGKPMSGYDYDTFASDLNHIVTALDLKGAALVGFSMGGGEVARFLGHYGAKRVSKAMFLGSVTPYRLKADDNPRGLDKGEIDEKIAALKADRLRFLEKFFTNFYNADAPSASLSADLIPFSKWIAWGASPLATQKCVTAFSTTDFRKDLAAITIPTCVVHGDQDRIVPMELSALPTQEMVKGSRLEIIKGAPHGFNATHAPQLNKLMIDFLRA
jgi:non-heme chloroperoxidase